MAKLDITEILGTPKKTHSIPYYKFITRGRGGSSKVQCEDCKKIKRVKNMAMIKGKILCSDCRQKLKNITIEK